ncbi:MAG: DUF2165 domain-containing protein [Legionellaceae bacterium]|nr:DUF2165 domain-containing protein [Legionellaceae bacterium]
MRIVKIALITSLALLFSLFALNNMMDFDSNRLFVQHVLSMDTTFKHQSIMWRAISNPTIQLCSYYVIIGWEIITALVCWCGSFALLSNINASSIQFNQAKKIASFGLLLGFLLYMVGFIIIAGEWFCMWQSTLWNGQQTAGLFINFILLTLIVLMIKD